MLNFVLAIVEEPRPHDLASLSVDERFGREIRVVDPRHAAVIIRNESVVRLVVIADVILTSLVMTDKKKEMFWVEKAALKGDVDSQLKMAEAYLTGNGVKKNKKMAAEMYEKAAVSGNQDAAIKLVYSYGTGKGMKKDESQCLMWFNRLSLENQLEVAEDFDENPKIKCTIGLVINMYEEIAKTKNYEAMKRFAELSVDYRGYDNAVKALNLLENANNVSYSTKNADVYMLWGKLHERQGNIGEAISCYRNSGTQEGRERAIMLNR